MSKSKIHVLAFYLPQFHPIPENDQWWGRGFTEWTNVAKAKPLYSGHVQPKIPSDLGFYDLRLPEVREQQAELAKEAGVSAFCYWHYWFGNGKQLLERPLKEVVKLGKPDFPFCLAWANHSWKKKQWNSSVSRFCEDELIHQDYPGDKDIEEHFYTILPILKDNRYYKINNKLVFVIYDPIAYTEVDRFILKWNELALKNDLPAFYFIAHIQRKEDLGHKNLQYFDGINFHPLPDFLKTSKFRRLLSFLIKKPILINYKKIIDNYDFETVRKENIFPTIYPNWDVTPRRGFIGTILKGATPELFYQHALQVFKSLSKRENENQIVFLKSWNEWGEGNYMEPDLTFGKGYIEALKKALENNE